MKPKLFAFFLVLISSQLIAQSDTSSQIGKVSFVSSKNVYVRFNQTKNIEIGDTLLFNRDGNLIPALIVTNKSSTSVVCTPIIERKFNKKEELIAKIVQPIITTPSQTKDSLNIEPENASAIPVVTPKEDEESLQKQEIRGRISAASYSSLSNYRNSHRMRYAFLLRGKNHRGTKWSSDSYLTFRHTLGEWDKVKNNLGNALKIYALAATYNFSPSSRLVIGRKINPKLTSVGAIDGLQFEKEIGNFLIGTVLGTRPNHSDYGFNINLFQYGAYLSLHSNKHFGYSTLGFMEQHNASAIDRRFIYFQHSGQLTQKVNLFSSLEADLYKNINGQKSHKPQLTNFYFSLNYRPVHFLRLSASFDSRKNIIYYESYKSFIDQLIEDETRQGLRFGITLRPFKNIIWGVNTGVRFQNSNQNASANINTYLSTNKLPWINVRATIQASLLKTNYLNSQIYGIRFSKPFLKDKLNIEIYYRNVNYVYRNSEIGTAVRQHLTGVDLSYRINRKLSFHIFYEGAFDTQNTTFTRINLRIIQRF